MSRQSQGRSVRASVRARVAALASLLAMTLVPLLPAVSEAATGPTAVTLTFDNNTISQYNLAFLQALQPHGAHATFFINSGTVGGSANFMSWTQLTNLRNAGNEIGGKTIHGINLKNTTDFQTKVDEVCNDRQAILQHGIGPAISFAYPGGAFDQTAKDIVRNCGYGNARTAGSLSPSGPRYAETNPPADYFAVRAYAPTGQITLANMEALVNGASANGGGWAPIVIMKVCSQTLDPNNYSTCTASSGWIQLADLNSFLDWVAAAGQAGAAPVGTRIDTAQNIVTASDTTAPTTSISCNGSPCASTAYSQPVTVTLSATDAGSTVASTRYTTDGSDPTTSSPAYTGPFTLTASATVKFRSWDIAGNVEAVRSQAIQVLPPPDSTPPTTTITCNGSACSSSGYTGSVTVALSATDNPGGWGVDKTYYTLDGSTPTTSSPVYTQPFNLSQLTTVKFFSTDLAGNAESVQTQQIQVVPPTTVVSLTFDDGTIGQYTLGFQRALQPHGMNGTFYIVTGDTSVYPGYITWPQLADMASAGNEIAGHTVDHLNLTDPTLTYDQKVHQVCDGRQALIDHGFSPSSFAYPEGAYDQTAEQIVDSCGFTTARTTGGLSATGPAYAETIPPKDVYATRTQPVSTTGSGPLQLSTLESIVTSGAAHGGGWEAIVFHRVCSQTFAPADYTDCIGSFHPIELDTLNAFLDWLGNAGQPGGAPAGVSIKTVRQVLPARPDTTAPVTSISCDDSPCQSAAYGGSVMVRLSATDAAGSGVAKTYYTTDGSIPTTASQVYTGPFVLSQPTTVNFFSVDVAGNAEQVQSRQIQVGANPDPVVAAAGDIACDPSAPAFNGGNGTATDCRAMGTSNLLVGADDVLAVGDDQYNCGGYQAFQQSYDPTWGRFNSVTHPVPGDKDYATTGGTDCPSTPGAGYYQYFGSTAGDPSKGYYSYDLGTWHVVALNTAPCPSNGSTCAAGSAQEQWLRSDLAGSSAACTLAYFQNPRFASTSSGGSTRYAPLWNDLYAGGADVVLNGDAHWYERFAPMDATGAADPNFGVREFIVGTGGAGLDTPSTQLPTSQVINNNTHGVIRLVLRAGAYDWTFVHDTDGTFSDSGTGSCHGAPPPADTTAPTTTITCNNAACSTGWYGTSPVTVRLSATDNQGGSGVDKTYYTTDGSTPSTSSTLYTGAFTVPSTATVKFFSTDLAGNAEAVHSQLIRIDTTAPTTTISCAGAPCSASAYTGSVSVSLSATDNQGGSGVAATVYTTDGSDPASSATATTYTGPFAISQTTTVKFFSTDLAGNAESTVSQIIQVSPAPPPDTTPPTTTITCNDAACSAGWYGTSSVTVRLSATDNQGGSGVDKTYYTTDGSTPSTSSTVYAGPFNVSSTATVKFFSTDLAGNAEAVQSRLIQIDTTAPTTTVTCNNAACSTGWYRAAVTVRLSATDNQGGSGVGTTYYTTDGSIPTQSSTVYTGQFDVASTATVKFFSTDVAGNAEAVNSQLIRIDGAAPTVTMTNPANNSSFKWGTKITVAANAIDQGSGSGGPSGIAQVTFYLDGAVLGNDSTSPYSIQWNPNKRAVGTHTLSAVATDVAGNSATSATVTVTITN